MLICFHVFLLLLDEDSIHQLGNPSKNLDSVKKKLYIKYRKNNVT